MLLFWEGWCHSTYFVSVPNIRGVVKVLLSVLSVLGANPRLQPYGGAPPAPGFRRFAISIFANCPFTFLSITLPRYNNPLHMFAESFLDRTRAAARYFLWRDENWSIPIIDIPFFSSASIATNGELTFSSTFGGGSAQLTRIDESSLTGQLNLRCQCYTSCYLMYASFLLLLG